MKIEIHRLSGSVVSETFEEFAERHDLVMEVCERGHEFAGTDMQFYAQFKHSEVQDAAGVVGNWFCIKGAIDRYKKAVLGKVLVINANKPNHEMIQCPNEWLPDGRPVPCTD